MHHVSRANDYLTSSVSLAQYTPQENRLQMMERNILSLGKALNRFIQAQRTSREQERNDSRYVARGLSVRRRYKSSHRSRLPHVPYHYPRQSFESPTFLDASQFDMDDDSESYFAYHNLPSVTENQSISSQVREDSSKVKDQVIDEKTLDIFRDLSWWLDSFPVTFSDENLDFFAQIVVVSGRVDLNPWA